MKLKDILELGTYGFNPDCKVEIFNMDNFEERLENEGFDEILIPQNEDTKIYPYAFLIVDSILIAMTNEALDNRRVEIFSTFLIKIILVSFYIHKGSYMKIK